MNWDAIAAIAELLAALGVIASLVYLATQVRSNALQARQAAVRSVQLQVNSVLASVSDGSQLAEVYAKQLKGFAELDSTAEILQMSALYVRLMRLYEELYQYRKVGLVDEWAWSSVHSLVVSSASTHGFADWWATRGTWFTPEFRAHIASVMTDDVRDVSEDYASLRGPGS
jgi:hypothetical protein